MTNLSKGNTRFKGKSQVCDEPIRIIGLDSECRSCGCRSRTIETLKALYPDTQQVVDMEMLDDSADNNKQ